MDEMTNSQELARRFNEDDAAWRAYENRRRQRLLKRVESLLSDAIVDELDWIEAEREARTIRCVGRVLPNA